MSVAAQEGSDVPLDAGRQLREPYGSDTSAQREATRNPRLGPWSDGESPPRRAERQPLTS